jgi:hypothetical protein
MFVRCLARSAAFIFERMTIKSLSMIGLSGIACLVLVAGCGSSDDSKPAAAQGTPNKQGASSATQTTISAVQTAIKPAAGGADAGQSSASQLSTAAQATQNLVTPAAATAKSLPGLELADLLRPLGNPPAGTTGTCTCTADSCTFVACSAGGVTIDGTYAFGGGHIKTTDLKYTINVGAGGAVADVVINVEADITATATSINGSFHSKGSTTASAGGQSYSSTWDSTLDFKNVTFASGGGAPTGGSEHVSSTTNVTSGGASQAYAGDFDVTFPSN